MKTTIYIPVYIEGKEENLPKETGYYFAHIKDDRMMAGPQFDIAYFPTNSSDPTYLNYWENYIDWYLRPVVLPDDEEIKREAFIIKHDEIPREYITKRSAWYGGANWFKSQILNK